MNWQNDRFLDPRTVGPRTIALQGRITGVSTSEEFYEYRVVMIQGKDLHVICSERDRLSCGTAFWAAVAVLEKLEGARA